MESMKKWMKYFISAYISLENANDKAKWFWLKNKRLFKQTKRQARQPLCIENQENLKEVENVCKMRVIFNLIELHLLLQRFQYKSDYKHLILL